MSSVLRDEGVDVKPTEEAVFYEEARSFDDDRRLRLDRSERRAWMVAAVACVIALGCVLALILVMPLKQSVPYLLSVDRNSGNVEVIDVAEPRTIQYKPLLDKHWAQRYVVARESYQWQMLQQDYDIVLAMSSTNVGREYAELYEGAEARDKKLGPAHELRIKVISVTAPPDTEGRMAVRFERQLRRVDSGPIEPPQTFVATMSFEYHVSVTAVERQLLLNPLGFRVTGYRLDGETTNTKPLS